MLKSFDIRYSIKIERFIKESFTIDQVRKFVSNPYGGFCSMYISDDDHAIDAFKRGINLSKKAVTPTIYQVDFDDLSLFFTKNEDDAIKSLTRFIKQEKDVVNESQ